MFRFLFDLHKMSLYITLLVSVKQHKWTKLMVDVQDTSVTPFSLDTDLINTCLVFIATQETITDPEPQLKSCIQLAVYSDDTWS